MKDNLCVLEKLISTCEVFNPLDYSTCEKCIDGYVRLMDTKTCELTCPEQYTYHRITKECHLDFKEEAAAKKTKRAGYGVTVVATIVNLFQGLAYGGGARSWINVNTI